MPSPSPLRRTTELLFPLLAPALTLAVFLAFLPPARYTLIYGDPDYAYFVSSLLLLRGEGPQWVDHPGTPVQSLGALVLLLWNALAGKESTLEASFFLHSFHAHRAMTLTLVAFLLAAQLWCGRALRRLGYSQALSFLVQLSPLLFFETFAYLRRVSPETPLAAVSLLLVPVLARAIDDKNQKSGPWPSLAAGMLLGFAASLKAVSLPLALLLFLLPAWKQRGLALASMAFFYVNLTAVIWHKYPFMLEWYASVLTHRNEYGKGGAELFSLSALGENLGRLCADFRFRAALAWLPALALLPFLKARLPRWPLLLSAAVYLFLILKHPEPRYLAPFVAVLGLLFLRAAALPQKAQLALAAAILAVSFSLNYRPALWARAWLTEEAEESSRLEAALAEKKECLVGVIGPVPLRVFALMSGDRASHFQVFGKSFEPLFPGYTFLNQGFALPSRFVPKEEWLRLRQEHPCLVLVGREDTAPQVFRTLFGSSPVPLGPPGVRYPFFAFPHPPDEGKARARH